MKVLIEESKVTLELTIQGGVFWEKGGRGRGELDRKRKEKAEGRGLITWASLKFARQKGGIISYEIHSPYARERNIESFLTTLQTIVILYVRH